MLGCIPSFSKDGFLWIHKFLLGDSRSGIAGSYTSFSFTLEIPCCSFELLFSSISRCSASFDVLFFLNSLRLAS